MENIYFDLSQLKYLGKGAIIGKTVRIRKPEAVSIGDGTIIDDFTYIACSADIGSYCHIGPNVSITGGTGHLTLGHYVGISAGSCLYLASSDYMQATLDLPSVPEEFRFGGQVADIRAGNFVLLGSHTVILPGTTLPEGFASAAHTVVRCRKYEEWTLYAGFECKQVCIRTHNELQARKSDLIARASKAQQHSQD